MVEAIYIQRRLAFSHQTIDENQVLQLGRYVVVLAEPGAGKSKFLANVAKSLHSECIRASIFRYGADDSQSELLIIDGFDEVAKLDDSAIDAILAKAGRKKTTARLFREPIKRMGRGSFWRYYQRLSWRGSNDCSSSTIQ